MTVFKIVKVNETVRTIYQELFTIRFVHTGYETPKEKFISKGIRIEPDADTRILFKNHRIEYRFDSDSLVCFVQCELVNPPAAEPKIPIVGISGDFKIRFLVFSSSDFAARTYVVGAGSKKTYQFTNLISNASGAFVFLTRVVENHSANDYEAGTIVANGGNLFSARKTVLAADGIAISNTSFWKQLQPVQQVVNNADLQSNAIVKSSDICWAVIDISKNGTTNNSYKILDTGDKLFKPAPVFTIKFNSMI